jgi:hypothetical protein
MTIINAHIYYPSAVDSSGGLTAQTVSGFDLRDIICWNDATAIVATTMVNVRYDFNGTVVLLWPKVEFEAAKLASLAAGG